MHTRTNCSEPYNILSRLFKIILLLFICFLLHHYLLVCSLRWVHTILTWKIEFRSSKKLLTSHVPSATLRTSLLNFTFGRRVASKVSVRSAGIIFFLSFGAITTFMAIDWQIVLHNHVPISQGQYFKTVTSSYENAVSTAPRDCPV